MTIPEIVAGVALIGFTGFAATAAVLVLAWRWLPGVARDHRDEVRVFLAYLKVDAWDLSPAEIGSDSKMGTRRLYGALLRLENRLLIEGYWQGGWRYVLTKLGRDAALDLERARIDELGKSSG